MASGPGAYRYQPTNVDDPDDEPDLYARATTSRLNSPDSSHEASSSQQQQLYSTMEFPGSPGDGGKEFEWQSPMVGPPGQASAGDTKATTKKRATIALDTRIPGEEDRGRTPDLDSLLEYPIDTTDSPTGFSELGHKRTQSESMSEIGSVSGLPLSPTSRKEKRKSLSATIGEKAFKSPILVKSMTNTSSGQRRKMHPREIIDKRAELTATWGIYWYLPSLMVAVFIAGLIGAVGHHSFYKSLDGTRSINQLSMIRIGTAFAFFVKANLVGAVVLAYRQRIWLTMRTRAMRLKAIDALFGVIEDPTFFFVTPEMIKNAKLASLMALMTWLIPIASVLSPSSLTSEVSLVTDQGLCAVSTLNFTAENDYDYRNDKEYFGNSIAFYNLTDMENLVGNLSYDMPSFISQRLASQAIYNHGSVGPPQSPCMGFNCTYILKMAGPGYKCENVTEDSVVYNRMPVEVRKENFAPYGRWIYYANVTNGDFVKPNNESRDKDLDPDWIVGEFIFEPELWIGYVVNTNVRLKKPVINHDYDPVQNKTYTNTWEFQLEPRIFHCVHYHVDYTLNVSYINTKQSVQVEKIDYKRPLLDTVYGDIDPRGGGAIIQPNPAKFIRPGEKDYKVVSVYHALGVHLRTFLKGSIYADSNTVFTQSSISMTNLIDPKTAFPVNDLEDGIKRLHQDIIVTLWGNGNLVVSANETVPCTMSRSSNRFKYYARNLWIGYSIVVTITLACIIVGAMALRSNGISSDTLFSRILVTTRNPTLDHLSRGACLGSDPFPRELEETKLRFGVLHAGGMVSEMGLGVSESGLGLDGKPGHCAFGTVHETTEIIKGGLYAGLDVGVRRAGGNWQESGSYDAYDSDSDSNLGGDDEDGEEEHEEDIFHDFPDEKIPLLHHQF